MRVVRNLCTILCTVLAFLVIIYSIFLPRIVLKGESSLIINYKQKYVEKGCKATILGKDLTDRVKLKGKVNNNKLGDYKIEYIVSLFGIKFSQERIVKVRDISKPVIELNGLENTYVCPNTKYKDEGAKAFDNYDKDITKKIRIEKKDDSIIYTVSDSSNNINSVTRKLIYDDKTKPEIKLSGSEELYVSLGGSYSDPGYIATDNCDGDVTNKVKTSGGVDTSKQGSYEITYFVQDSKSNKSEVKRKVIVSNGVIYLTFDDGPQMGTTNVILDILKEEGVKATFFVTNKGDDSLIKREYDEGHTVALHTATHDYAILYASDEAYFNDLYSVQNRVKRITGIESKIIRFPGGSSNTISRRYSQGIMSRITKEVLNRGFKYYDWNLSSGDAAGGTPSSSDIYNNVVNNLRHDRVNMVLMHDIKPYTRDALRDIIRYGKQNGYRFEKITEDTEMVTQRVNN